MKKLVYLPFEYSKEDVTAINLLFKQGYDIDSVLDAAEGYYLFLVLNESYNYSDANDKYKKSILNLIEENRTDSFSRDWSKTSTEDIKPV